MKLLPTLLSPLSSHLWRTWHEFLIKFRILQVRLKSFTVKKYNTVSVFDSDMIEHCLKIAHIHYKIETSTAENGTNYKISESTTLIKHVSFLSLPQEENRLELVISISLFGICAHTLTQFPTRLLSPCEIFSVFRIISVSFFGCTGSNLHSSFDGAAWK